MKNELNKAWSLKSFEIQKESGETLYPYGKDAIGCLIYTAEGHFSAQAMRNDRPNFASDDQMKGTPDEMQDNFKGVISYFGHYTWDEAENAVTHHVEGSLFPNWQGTSMKRLAKIENDTLELSTEPITWGGENRIGKLVWIKK